MIEFLAANLPVVICFIIGVGLLVAEVFMPGFGVAGISGIVLEVISIILTYLKYGGLAALGLTIVILAMIGISISFSLRSVTKGRLSKSPIILKQSETSAEGYIATADMDVFTNREGVTTTALRPTGIAEFDGVRLNVVSEGDFIPKATPVRVTRVDGMNVVVRRMADKQPGNSNNDEQTVTEG